VDPPRHRSVARLKRREQSVLIIDRRLQGSSTCLEAAISWARGRICLLSSGVGHYGPRCSRSAQRTLEGMGENGPTYNGGLGLTQPPSGAQRLDDAETMRLLASVDYGRVVFTLAALPAIRPVNHLVEEGRVIIRTRLTSAISAALGSADEGVVVAYEADSFDPGTRTGWSVVVTGRAYTVTDPEQVLRYEQLLDPWVNYADTVIAIEPGIVTGFHIVAAEA
jgi:Pyridoxamine 5'-phosphate oxidase